MTLKAGSTCFITSTQSGAWLLGQVQCVFSDEEGEWLKVQYIENPMPTCVNCGISDCHCGFSGDDILSNTLTCDVKRFSIELRSYHVMERENICQLDFSWQQIAVALAYYSGPIRTTMLLRLRDLPPTNQPPPPNSEERKDYAEKALADYVWLCHLDDAGYRIYERISDGLTTPYFPDEPVKPRWVARLDTEDSGELYFENADNGVMTKDKPDEFYDPDGKWLARREPECDEFFYQNIESHEAQWEAPECFQEKNEDPTSSISSISSLRRMFAWLIRKSDDEHEKKGLRASLADYEARLSLTIGSSCQVYDHGWLEGQIVRVVEDDGEEQLRVALAVAKRESGATKFDFDHSVYVWPWRRTIAIGRGDALIRPSAFPVSHPMTNPSMNRSRRYWRSHKPQHVFSSRFCERTERTLCGFLRRLEHTPTRSVIRHIANPCLHFLADYMIADDNWRLRSRSINSIRVDPATRTISPSNIIYFENVHGKNQVSIDETASCTWRLCIGSHKPVPQYAHQGTLKKHNNWDFTIGICTIKSRQAYLEGRGHRAGALDLARFTGEEGKGYGLHQPGTLYHASTESSKVYYNKRLCTNDIVEVHLDLIAGHLSYSVNGQYLGVAFDDIDCNESYCLAVMIGRAATKISLC